jgi:large subunit ribosomal protein L25
MSSVDFNIIAEVRNDLGKGASRRLRHQGKIPAVVYGGNKDPLSLTVDHDDLYHQLEREAFYSHILTLTIDGKGEKVVLKDLQRHPSKPFVTHADFLRVSAKEKIRMQVPLHFLGEEVAPGVKIGGGMISHNITEVEVSCLPGDLPEFIEVDLSELQMEQSVHLSDIILPEGIELVELSHGAEHDQAVAAIHKTRGTVEAETAEAGEGAAAEGEGE